MRTLRFLVLCFLSASGLLAQTNTGSIQGTVTDPNGAPIGGASVTVRNMDTGATVKTQTTGAGVYSAPNLPPGQYSVSMEQPGMQHYLQEGITVSTSTTATVNIQAQVGNVQTTVTVSENAPQLETTTSDYGATVEPTLVQNLPLQVSGTVRNPVQFIELIPGFTGSVGNNPGSNSTDDFKVNGGQENATDILVDGLSISLVSPNTQWNKGVSTEAVKEFRVLQSDFSAEFGESGDGIVSLSLKSGTNQYHGSAYDFLRNRELDANSWTDNMVGQPRPIDTQNDFGGSLGGPVWLPKLYNGKNKTFFFGDYEGFRFSTGGSSVISVPTEAMRKGDFSALLAQGTQLYDPVTHNPVPGNILTNDPNYKPSAVITKALSFLPTTTNNNLQNNAINSSISHTSADLYDIKVDENLGDRQHFSVGYDVDHTDTGGVSSLGPIFGSHTPQNTHYFRINDTQIISPNVVNQFLGGISRRWRGEVSEGLDAGYPNQLGLQGVENTTFPCIIFLGSPYQNTFNNCGDSQFADNVFQYADSVSWVHGKHIMQFGGEIRFLQFNVRRLTTSSGEFDFSPIETSFNGAGGDPVASALFGIVHQGFLNYGSTSGTRYRENALYAQDSYRITQHLTLNYGLRYDIDVPATEAHDRFSMVDPNLPDPDAGGIPGGYIYYGSGPGRNGQTRPQDIYTKAFGPRVGFAYSMNDKTVLRAGYGIFYEPLKEGSYADQDGLGFFNKETLTTGNGAPFSIDTGFPHYLPQSGPFTPSGQNGNAGVIYVPANSGRPADVQSWHVDVQRQIANNLMGTVSYVGSKGTHLPALNIIPNQVNPAYLSLGNDLNQNITCLGNGGCPAAAAAGVAVPYAGFTGTVAQALRPFPQYGNFNQEDNSFTPDRTGNSTYHALQAQLNKRFAAGISFLVAYTFSKNLTDADSSGPGVSGFTGTNSFIGQNSYDRRNEKAVSELDVPQSLVASFVYELPVGHGKRYLNGGGWINRAVSGWSISGILSYKSGQPLEVYGPCGSTSAENVLFAMCNFTGSERVNVLQGVNETNKSSNFNPQSTPFYNLAAFALPAPFTFGDEGRSLPHARNFGTENEDLTLQKKTKIAETVSLNIQAAFFNAFNRHIFGAPVGGTPFGTPFQAAYTPGCSGPFACGFGAVTSSSGPRVIQVSAALTF